MHTNRKSIVDTLCPIAGRFRSAQSKNTHFFIKKTLKFEALTNVKIFLMTSIGRHFCIRNFNPRENRDKGYLAVEKSIFDRNDAMNDYYKLVSKTNLTPPEKKMDSPKFFVFKNLPT